MCVISIEGLVASRPSPVPLGGPDWRMLALRPVLNSGLRCHRRRQSAALHTELPMSAGSG
jgi:hypothetical protein